LAKQQTLNGKSTNGNGANLGFEQKLWAAADKLRNNMDAAEYKHFHGPNFLGITVGCHPRSKKQFSNKSFQSICLLKDLYFGS
jgi:hypothetical protein